MMPVITASRSIQSLPAPQCWYAEWPSLLPCQVEVTNGHLGFLAYEARFYAPHKQAGSNTPLFYSYEVRL